MGVVCRMTNFWGRAAVNGQSAVGPIADAGDQVNEWQLVIGEPGAGNDGNVGVD